jgi:tyrosine-protein kinase Etk/Wzc
MNTVTGGLIGMVVGLILALLVETMDTSLGTIEDVEEILNIPVLGVIPSTDKLVPKEKDREEGKLMSGRLVTHFAPRSPVAEAYRSLRTSLQFIRMDKKAKVFLITSSSLQEGKTYTVVNLSLSLAQAGEKVLLIDADLRRPVIHRVFGTQRQPGLTEYIMDEFALSSRGEDPSDQWKSTLIGPGHGGNDFKDVVNNVTDIMLGEFEIDDILRTPGLENLHLINAGASPINPSEILRSPQFKELLNQARTQYDIIIIDTPPVLPVADAFEVAPEVDGVVLVYEVGRIGRGILNRAKIQLENLKANVLGVILNNVKPDVSPDIYGYSTVYYYREEGAIEDHLSSPRWWKPIQQSIGWLYNKMRPIPATERRR